MKVATPFKLLLDVSTIFCACSVTVAGLTAADQTFSAVTNMSDDFGDDPIDGILGLAWPQISALRAVSWYFLNDRGVNAGLFILVAVFQYTCLPRRGQRRGLRLQARPRRLLAIPWRYRQLPIYRLNRIPSHRP